MMKKKAVFTMVTIMLFFSVNSRLHAQGKKDSVAIMQVLGDEIVSWDKKDAARYASHFAQTGTFTNLLGMFFTGYDNFLHTHEHVFTTVFRGTSMQQQLVSIQFAASAVAVVETITTITGFSADGPPPGTTLDGKGKLNTRLLQTMVRTGDVWKIIAYHNVDIKAGVAVPKSP